MTTRAHISEILTVIIAALLVAGIPYALWALAGNPLPHTIPTVDTIRNTLTIPDNGTLFLRTLTITGWLSWALFGASLVIPRRMPSEGTRP